MKNEHKKAPTTVSEIGIHIGYINEKLDDIVGSLKDSPSRAEFEVVKADVQTLKDKHEQDEARFITRREFAVAGTIIGLIITIVNFGINIFNNIKG